MRKVPYLIAFSTAMGYLEAAVVVYLREIYYPAGFHFPITIITGKIVVVELLRELSTIIMLAVPAALAARGFYARLAAFSLMFGVWDIVYYVSLKAVLDWPASLMTWDILFLIPVPWVGPVAAPCAVSICLIAGGLIVLRRVSLGVALRGRPWEWALAVAGALTVITSFTLDFRMVISSGGHGAFRWPLFAAGLAMGWVGFVSMLRRAGGASGGAGSRRVAGPGKRPPH
jgi:hypothetical protein